MEVNHGLTQMLNLQKVLVDHYIKIESLPEYPLDLTIKSSQRVIKDFIYRTLEELGEAYSALITMCDYCMTNNKDKADELLPAFYEELSDAMHFILETFIYSGMHEGSIMDGLRNEEGMEDMNVLNPVITELLKYIRSDVSGMNQNINTVTCYPIGNGTRILYMSEKEIEIHMAFLWNITYLLTKAGNALKNRPWRQSETDKVSNVVEYQNTMYTAFKVFIAYYNYLKMNEEMIVRDYMAKNEINLKRITDGY